MEEKNVFIKPHEGPRTEKMYILLNDLTKEFKSMYSKIMFDRKLAALKASRKSSCYYSVLNDLLEMLTNCDIPYEKDRDYKYYEKLVTEAVPGKALTADEMEDRMIYALYSHYESCLSPQQYMRSVVDMQTPTQESDSSWKNDTLRLRILKQFIKYGDCLKGAGGGGKAFLQAYIKNKLHIAKSKVTDDMLIENIDDTIFEALESATTEQKKLRGRYGLLRLCDDLADGNFTMCDNPRRALYLFAMAFDMTYYSGEKDEWFFYNSDIERRLFRDSYSNDFMSYLSKVYGKRPLEGEAEPSGQGINYKNFKEMVCLYYISKDSKKIAPAEKISSACRMIEELKAAAAKEDGKAKTPESKGTKQYRGYFFFDGKDSKLLSADVFRKDEAEFKKFILEHYPCEKSSESYITEQKTARENYCKLRNKFIAKVKGESDLLSFCNYGLCFFSDIQSNGEKYAREFCKQSGGKVNFETAMADFKSFVEMLKSSNLYLKRMPENSGEIAEKKRPVTRAAVLALYYYLYNAKTDYEREPAPSGFNDFFNNFKQGIDEVLRNSYYQELNGKNIFDVLIAFSSYAYLYLA